MQGCFRFYLLCCKLESVEHYEQFFLPRNLETANCFDGIYAGSANTKIFLRLGVNLRTVLKIRKEFEESSGNYEGTIAWKFHCYRFNKKLFPNFLVRSML